MGPGEVGRMQRQLSLHLLQHSHGHCHGSWSWSWSWSWYREAKSPLWDQGRWGGCNDSSAFTTQSWSWYGTEKQRVRYGTRAGGAGATTAQPSPPVTKSWSWSWLVMSNQRFSKIVCFRFPTNVPPKNQIYSFLKQNSLSNQNVLF
jgi:hypothetical protein